MPVFQCRANLVHRASPIWVLLYLPIHQIVAQTFFQYENVALFLRIAFLILVVGILLLKREGSQVRDIFIGRWLQDRKDWMAIGLCLLLIIGARVVLYSLIQYGKEDPSTYVLTAIAPPLNEEVVFRGLFLSALLAYFPRWSFGAVLLSSAMFVGCHSLFYTSWPVWIALTVQSLIYGVCYLWTGCVPACVLCHWFWNTSAFIG